MFDKNISRSINVQSNSGVVVGDNNGNININKPKKYWLAKVLISILSLIGIIINFFN